ncbi:hypothetical protein [Xanthomonas euvesicatoria]|uniref:hypothetical protein n=1 Tax=Xanthomonas euvesicatoria TaxID=456327 RepID=UPI0030C7E0E6
MKNKTEPDFKWYEYIIGTNMIAGTVQMLGFVFVISLAVGTRALWFPTILTWFN